MIRVKTELVQTLEPQRRIIILRMRVGLLVPAMGRGTKWMVLTLLLNRPANLLDSLTDAIE